MDEHTQSYNDFIRMGDTIPTSSTSNPVSSSLATSASASASAIASDSPSTTTTTSTENQTNIRPSSNTTQNPSAPSPSSSGGFFSSFLRKATTTIESSIQAAQQNGSEALSSAQQHMSAASTSAFTTVSGLVQDLGTTFHNQNNSSSSSRTTTNGTAIGIGGRRTTTTSSSNQSENPPSRPDKTLIMKSFKLSSNSKPLLLFDSPVPTIVSQSALYIFNLGPNTRPTPVPLNIVQSRVSSTSTSPSTTTTTSSSSSSTTTTPSPHAAITATHAILMSGPRLAVAHDDGCVVIFSLSTSRVAAFEAATPPHPSPTTALATLERGLAIARRDGSVHLLNSSLQPIHNLPAPDLCAAPLTPTLTTAAAIALYPSIKKSLISVAYDDGSICTFSMTGQPKGPAFVAHCGAPSGILSLFNHDDLIVTIGNQTDKSIAVFDRYTGRCIARRALPFTPTCLHPILSSSSNDDDNDQHAPICPSASAILVGGDEGQVEAFRIVALSSYKVDIKLVLRLCERQRGKKKNIIQISYHPEPSSILSALNENGEVKRWQLSKADASQLCLLEEERWTGSTFTQANILEIITRETSETRPSINNNEQQQQDEDSSINANSANSELSCIVRAQSILATILDDHHIQEERKDELVTTFQRMQTEMRTALADADKDVRRARRRIYGQFSSGLKTYEHNNSNNNNSTVQQKQQQTPLEICLVRETKRAAAFEAEYVTKRYVENIRGVERNTIEKVKTLLTDFLNSLPNNEGNESLILQQARRDIDMLGIEEVEAEVEVD